MYVHHTQWVTFESTFRSLSVTNYVTVPCHSQLVQSGLTPPSSAVSSLCSVPVVPVWQSRDQIWLCNSGGERQYSSFIFRNKSHLFNFPLLAVKLSHHMVSPIYLHVCYLVLFPVEALHLVLFQLLSGLHILVIVTLEIKIDLHSHPTGGSDTISNS